MLVFTNGESAQLLQPYFTSKPFGMPVIKVSQHDCYDQTQREQRSVGNEAKGFLVSVVRARNLDRGETSDQQVGLVYIELHLPGKPKLNL